MKITYLKKASDEVISHCSCNDGRVTFPAQLDCPWCGCGWLFSCISCRKAFTFAVGVVLETSWDQLAREDLKNRWRKEPTEEDIESWIGAMKVILKDVRPGIRYVILDGTLFPAEEEEVEFDGWHAHHRFERLPQVEALADRAILERSLANRIYWEVNALPEEEA